MVGVGQVQGQLPIDLFRDNDGNPSTERNPQGSFSPSVGQMPEGTFDNWMRCHFWSLIRTWSLEAQCFPQPWKDFPLTRVHI